MSKGNIRVGVTIGDFNGVGMEVIIKTFLDVRILENITPIVYGSSSNYVDGINQTSSGFDETGLLNIYNSSGNTIGAVRKNTDGYAIYEDGNESSFISNPDNEGVSTIYRGGIPVGAQKTDNDGNITYYEDGNATGYSKKVRNGYENYDSGGIIKSFTATGKKWKN